MTLVCLLQIHKARTPSECPSLQKYSCEIDTCYKRVYSAVVRFTPEFIVSFFQRHVLPKSCSTKVIFYQRHVLPKACSMYAKVMNFQSHALPKSCSTKVRFYQSQDLLECILTRPISTKVRFYQIPFYQSPVCSKNGFYQIPFYQSQSRLQYTW
jgi:hypothetical protein